MPKTHKVRQGDCISSIAYDTGFFEDTIWNADENKDLKAKRDDRYVLLPGDVVTIPDPRIKNAQGATNIRHRFRRKGVPKKLRVCFLLRDKPIANMSYEILIDGKPDTGTTDGDGWLEKPIPPNAREAKVTLEDGTGYTLKLGYLEPLNEVAGVQDRLANFGFFGGKIDGNLTEETVLSIRRFQIAHGLEATGQIDDALKSKLLDRDGA